MRAILAPVTAVVTAAAVSFLLDVGVSVARGWNPDPGYVGPRLRVRRARQRET